MTPAAAPAARDSTPTLSERETLVNRVKAAVRAWGPYLNGESTSAPGGVAAAVEPGGRLAALGQMFDLDPVEADIVSTLWVLAFEPEWRAAIAAIDGRRADVTALAVARLYGHAPRPRLSSESPLLAWRIVAEHAIDLAGNPGLSLDPHILAWLEGRHEIDRALIPFVHFVGTGGTLESWPVPRTIAAARETLRSGERLRVQVIGRDAGTAAAFAAAVAAGVGLPLLSVSAGALDADAADIFVRLQRQAFLDRCALLWPRLSGPYEIAQWPDHVAWFPLQFGAGDTQAATTRPGTRELVVTLPPSTAAERRMLWLRALPEAHGWDAGALDRLADRYCAHPADIAAVAAMRPASCDDAIRQLLARSRGDLGTLAQRLETSFTWDDLIVPAAVRDVLRDIAFEANDRTGFWEQPHVAHLFPQGRGLVALFCGPPGTGKTMAAQVIAAELGLDLHRIDLSAVISRWVGETSQNLQAVLSRAADRNLALFFDEADALYGKRVDEVRDAQDRFANMDISHLMVAIENYSGVVLLASNLKGNIDPAFIRRIRYCVEFTKPDRGARREIWQRIGSAIWGASVMSCLAAALDELAECDATGAQIKHACLSAAFAARRVGGAPTAQILAQALARELAKDGQGMSPRMLAGLSRDRAGAAEAVP